VLALDAKALLRQLVDAGPLSVVRLGKDRYGRTLAPVLLAVAMSATHCSVKAKRCAIDLAKQTGSPDCANGAGRMLTSATKWKSGGVANSLK
jgi:hypothetical protein